MNIEEMLKSFPMEKLLLLGDQIALDIDIDTSMLLKQLKYFDDKWAKYNSSKPWIKRDGLCIINEDGVNKSGPALESLSEWNKVHGTELSEVDFNVSTPVYDETLLKDVIKDIRPHCYRSHFLRLPPGGYFPPHRDHALNSFRVICPIQSCNPPDTRFMIEDKTLNWKHGRFYVLNTMKEHTLFNCSVDTDNIWLVLNVNLTLETVLWVNSKLRVR